MKKLESSEKNDLLKTKLKELLTENEAETIRHALYEIRGNHNPIDFVRWVPVEQVEANNYNPNAVASREMRLLALSILEDGYTQPIVTIWDEERQKYVIIDGFHRYTTMRLNKKVYALNGGLLPIVVLEKDMNQRMASTVRHNRARGKHSVQGMSSMVFQMLKNGKSDVEICNELGMEADELIRLKHVTGFAKLFAKTEYSRAYETHKQRKIRSEYEKNQEDEAGRDSTVLEQPEG